MLLGVCEGGDAPLIYGGEFGEEHMKAARPTNIRLLGGIVYTGNRCDML